MPGKTALASVCVTVSFLGLLFVGCGKGYRQVVVIDGDKAEVVTVGPAPKVAQKIWAAGRTLIFRTSSPVPGAPRKALGVAGHVYRVSESLALEEVAEFPLSVPNDTLAYTYGN